MVETYTTPDNMLAIFVCFISALEISCGNTERNITSSSAKGVTTYFLHSMSWRSTRLRDMGSQSQSRTSGMNSAEKQQRSERRNNSRKRREKKQQKPAHISVVWTV